MNLEEVTVSMKHGLPVLLSEDRASEYGKGPFQITNLEKSIPRFEKNYSYSAGLTVNGRCVYQVPIFWIEPHPDYLMIYESLLEELHRQNLKYDISYFLKNGEDETKIINTVRELIKEKKLMNERKYKNE